MLTIPLPLLLKCECGHQTKRRTTVKERLLVWIQEIIIMFYLLTNFPEKFGPKVPGKELQRWVWKSNPRFLFCQMVWTSTRNTFTKHSNITIPSFSPTPFPGDHFPFTPQSGVLTRSVPQDAILLGDNWVDLPSYTNWQGVSQPCELDTCKTLITVSHTRHSFMMRD